MWTRGLDHIGAATETVDSVLLGMREGQAMTPTAIFVYGLIVLTLFIAIIGLSVHLWQNRTGKL